MGELEVDPSLRLRRLLDCADALSKLDRNTEAIPLIEKVEREAGTIKLPDLWLQSQVLKGVVLIRVNRASEAEELLRRAAARAGQERNDFRGCAALINLSASRIRQYRFDEALPYARQALEAGERAKAGRCVAVAQMNLGIIHARLGDFDRAEQYQSLAVKSLTEIDDRRNLMDALGELGNLRVLRSNRPAALPSFEQAYNAARELNADAAASRWAGNLALALVGERRWDDAERWNNQARVLLAQDKTPRGLAFLKETAAVIAMGRKNYSEAERLLREILAEPDMPPFLSWEARAHLADLYLRTKKPAAANAQFEKALQAIEDVRADLLQSEFKLTFLSRLIDFFQQYVDALVDQAQIARALEVAEYSRARVLAERLGRQKEKIAAVRAGAFLDFARRNKAILVSYWLAPTRSFVWIVRPDGIRHAVLPREKEIAASTAAFRRLVEEELRDLRADGNEAARQLGETLLTAPRKLIPAGSRVILVPDGVLHRINFETLPVPGTGRYLIEDWSLSIAPSLSVLAGSKSEPARGRSPLLLVGAPEAQGQDYPALPRAGEEIGNIRRHFAQSPAEVFTGARATPASYRQSQPERFSLIHFAAHAETNRESPLDSAVILSREGDQFKLYARDVTGAKLTADLVTVSACRSAGARAYGGEGMVGFAWAFLSAGARAVIAGLWDVSDSSTAALMDRLYAGIAAGQTPEDALRAAKLALVNGTGPFRKPFYWGPMQVYLRAPAPRSR
jgi:CHAT domain-containing protein